MDPVTFFIFLACFKDLHGNQIVICDKPIKKRPCTIKCITADFTHTVSFSHPSNREVGGCDVPYDCGSIYPYYNVSQSVEKNVHITSLRISRLERDRDEGAWRCSYGNAPSQTAGLIVHTLPQTVILSKKEIDDIPRRVLIECMCDCVYPSDQISIKIKVTNTTEERKLETSLKILNHPEKCDKDEKVVVGSASILRKDLHGIDIHVKCICHESALGVKAERNNYFKLQGFIPNAPSDFRINSSGYNFLTVSWKNNFNGGYRQTFIIEYNISKKHDTIYQIKVEEETGKSLYSARISGLKPNSMYFVWIYSENAKGRSAVSPPFHFHTSAVPDHSKEADAFPGWIIAVIVIVILLIASILFALYRKWKRLRRMRQTPDPDTKENQGLMNTPHVNIDEDPETDENQLEDNATGSNSDKDPVKNDNQGADLDINNSQSAKLSSYTENQLETRISPYSENQLDATLSEYSATTLEKCKKKFKNLQHTMDQTT